MLLFEKRSDGRLGVACALLVLTRGEGIFLVLAMGIEHLRRGRPWPRARAYAIPALLLLGQVLFGLLYYGTPLSPTAASKIHQGRSGLWGEWPLFANVAYQFSWFFSSRPFLVLGWVALAAAGVLSLRLRRGSPDNATARPVAACRVKVVDIVNKIRLFPPLGAENPWQDVAAVGPPVNPQLYRSSDGRREIEQLLTSAIADQVTRLFYKHIPDELGSRLTPQ